MADEVPAPAAGGVIARYRKPLSMLVLVLMLGLAVSYVAQQHNDFAFVTDLDSGQLLLLAGITLGYLLTQCILFKVSVRPFGVYLQPMEWVGLMMVTFFSNYFIPLAGLGGRALYLSRRHSMSLTHFSVAMGGVLVVELLVYSLAGTGGLLATGNDGWDVMLTVMVLAGIAAAMLSTTVIPPSLVPFSGRIGDRLRLVIIGWHQMFAHRRAMAAILIWTIVQYGCFVAMFYVAFTAIGAPATWLAAIVVAALTNFAFLIRLAPAAAGSFEVAILFGAQLFDISVAQALVVAVLVRAAMIGWFILLGPWFSYKLLR